MLTKWETLIDLRFKTLISSLPTAKKLLDELAEEGALLLFGGVVRDLAYFNKKPRDIDIVVDTNKADLESHFKNLSYRKNRFGGYKLILENQIFDIWSLPLTWAFKNHIVADPNAKNLTQTVFLNIDSIVFDLKEKNLYENGFVEAVQQKTLDIVLEENPHPEVNIVRAMVFRQLHGYQFSNKLNAYIFKWITKNDSPGEILWKAQISHYGKEVISLEQFTKNITKVSNRN